MLTCALIPTQSQYFFFTPVSLKSPIQDYNSIIVIIWHTWAQTFFFLFLVLVTCAPTLSVIQELFLSFTPPNPLCCSIVWWQGASLLGRWDSNQSGLPRGASDRRARLPNCPQAGRPAGSVAATHVHRGTSAAALTGLLSVWITFLDRRGAIWGDSRMNCNT